MTFGSLFTGFGGMDLGLEAAGLRCIWQAENDPDACIIRDHYWPHVPNLGDVCAVEWGGVECPDLVCGGDPCQENSRANTRGQSPKHPSLAHEFLRCVAELRPRFVLRENPPARPDAPWPWREFRARLERLGYAVLPFRLRACCLGAEQRRERVFLLAEIPDDDSIRRDPLPQSLRDRSQDAYQSFRAVLDGRDAAPSWAEACAAALRRGDDGLPRWVHRAAIRGLGNAVAPPVAYEIGRRLMEAVKC